MEELLKEVLTETLNISPEELSSTLTDEEGKVKEGAKSELLTRFSNHVATIKSNAKDEGKGWGTREALKTFGKSIADKYEFDDTGLKADELVEKIIESKVSQTEETYQGRIQELEKSKGFTDEDVKKSQIYIDLENKLSASETERETAVNSAVESLKKEMAEKELFSNVVKMGLTALDGMNPILSEDAQRKQTQINSLFVEPLSQFGYQKNENGEIIPLDKATGNRIDNELGHALKLEDLFKQIADKAFDYKQSSDKNFKDKPDDKNNPTKSLPTTQSEYWDFLGDSSIDIQERNRVQKLYDSGELKLTG